MVREYLGLIPRFGAPFVTCEPSIKHCTMA